MTRHQKSSTVSIPSLSNRYLPDSESGNTYQVSLGVIVTPDLLQKG
jgi:hypothetical protein